jgi:selenocysteine-specific elongation factor
MADRRQLVLGTAGHIDHGKTALVKALTGVDTDRLPAERQRGITIDLGFAALDVGPYHLGIVDVPGHERFIRNMLAGATGLDLAMLVVAADDSVMPQTREHLEILRLLGLGAGVIVLTKCDLAESTWLDLVEDDIRALTAGTFLEGAEIVRTSAASGLGIYELKTALERLCHRAPARPESGLFRMAIDRTFTVAGHGTVVTGTVASGKLKTGDEVQWHPDGRIVRVRGLQQHDRPVSSVERGARAAINLTGIHHTEIVRGQELGAPGYLRPSRVLSVEVASSPDAPWPLRHRARYRLHLGTTGVTATLSLLTSDWEVDGAARLAQLFLAQPVVAVHGEPFVLREESPPATLGGGRILHPSARRIRRRDAPAIARLGRLRSTDSAERAAALLAFLGLESWSEIDLCREAGIALGEISGALNRLIDAGEMTELRLGPRRTARFLTESVAELEDRVLRALGRLHAAKARQSAIRRSHLFAALPDIGNDALISAVVDRLQTQSKLVSDERTVALRGYEPKLSQAERRLKLEISEAIRTCRLSPPDAAELAASAGQRASVVPELLELLVDEGQVVSIGNGFYLDVEVEAELRRRINARLADGSALTMAELRDLLGTTRKYAVPIGEYLDRTGLTRREGDVRRLGAVPGSAVVL